MSRLSLEHITGNFATRRATYLRARRRRRFQVGLSHYSVAMAATVLRTSRPRLVAWPYHFSHADLINAESRLGSTIFGPIPAGHRREFFHDQAGIWIWHEDWRDLTLAERQLTVRYEVRKSGVYKKVSAGNYFKLEGYELENFRRAAHAYLKVIRDHLYTTPQFTTI